MSTRKLSLTPGQRGIVLQRPINTLRPRQNGHHFADDTFKSIFFNENVRIAIEISLKFVPKGAINNIPALVQMMAWHRPGGKPLSEPMMVCLLMHICVTWPQWVNTWFISLSCKNSLCCNYDSSDPIRSWNYTWHVQNCDLNRSVWFWEEILARFGLWAPETFVKRVHGLLLVPGDSPVSHTSPGYPGYFQEAPGNIQGNLTALMSSMGLFHSSPRI